jgi:hypothetical protein
MRHRHADGARPNGGVVHDETGHESLCSRSVWRGSKSRAGLQTHPRCAPRAAQTMLRFPTCDRGGIAFAHPLAVIRGGPDRDAKKSRPRLYLIETTTAADLHSPQHFWSAQAACFRLTCHPRFPHDLARIIHNADARLLDRHIESSKIVHAALLLLMLEAAYADLVSPSAEAQHPNFQPSTSWPADYPIFGSWLCKQLASGSLATLASRTILPASSTMQTLVSLTDTSSPAK